MRWVFLALLVSPYVVASKVTVFDKEIPKRLSVEITGNEAKKLYEALEIDAGTANISFRGSRKEFVSEKGGKNILCFQDPFTKKKDKYTCWVNFSPNGRATKWDRENEQRVELRIDQFFLFKSGAKKTDKSDEVVKIVCDSLVEKSVAKGTAEGTRGPHGENTTVHLKPGEGMEFQDMNKNYLSVACISKTTISSRRTD
jgi:hypothetical protein